MAMLCGFRLRRARARRRHQSGTIIAIAFFYPRANLQVRSFQIAPTPAFFHLLETP
jgi:hypothetical protein